MKRRSKRNCSILVFDKRKVLGSEYLVQKGCQNHPQLGRQDSVPEAGDACGALVNLYSSESMKDQDPFANCSHIASATTTCRLTHGIALISSLAVLAPLQKLSRAGAHKAIEEMEWMLVEALLFIGQSKRGKRKRERRN